MKFILTTILVITCLSSLHSQVFFKKKSTCLNELNNKGIKYVQGDNPNQYWFIKYDEFGEAMVQLNFENDILRKAVFAQKTPQAPLERMHELFINISRKEALEWETFRGRATNTRYFSGKALYTITDTYIFTVIPIY